MRNSAIAAGHRVGGTTRPLKADPVPIIPGLAGRIVFIFAGHLPLVGRLPDRRIALILEDLENELAHYTITEAKR